MARATPPRASLSGTLTGPAHEAYEAARVLYSEGDPAGALAKFRQSHELSGDARLLWNMAVCERALHHYQRTRLLIERYLSEAPGVSAAERAEADETLAMIARLVGRVTLTVDEPGATVLIDSEPVGTTPLATVSLDIGRHVIRVEKPGFAPTQQTLEVTGGVDSVFTLKLERVSRLGTLIVHAPDDANISVDGQARGRGLWSGQVDAGPHTVRVTASGRREHFTTVDVLAQGTRSLEVTLEHNPVRWPWLVGAGVLVVGLSVGGYFLLRSTPDGSSSAKGTLDPGQVRLPFSPLASLRP